MLITVFVAGCSADRCYWYQPGKTFKQAKQGCRECYCEALTDASEVDAEYESSRVSVYERDPEHLPYLEDVTIWHQLHLANAVRGCMKRKGYRLTRASELDSEVHRKTTCVPGECFAIAGK